MTKSAYSEQVIQNLPRLLALFDRDPTNLSYGFGDRYHWAWGLIDFGNGTFQGAVHGLSRIWKSGLWPYETSQEDFLLRIDSLFHGAKVLTKPNGSLEEAFPREASFCVTALVAFDLLVAIDQLSDEVDLARRLKWLNIVSPMISFIIKNDESHGVISNHLSTAVAALIRWDKETGGNQPAISKAELFLKRILQNQSDEGWFKEYEGADPGYQSLCTHYLADAHLNRKDLNLFEPLRRSIRFLSFFANPDGSFGGFYGSRVTRFYYPSGVLALAHEIEEAHALSTFLAESICSQRVVSLSSMDESNLIPMFNSYAWSANLSKNKKLMKSNATSDFVIPCFSEKSFRKNFPEGGIIVDRGVDHYTVVNYKKGGVVQHYSDNQQVRIDTGIVIKSSRKKWGTSQHYDANSIIEFKGSVITIKSQVAEMPKRLPTPFVFSILRILSLSLFRFSSIRESIKKGLVKFLITRPKLWPIWNTRQIELGRDIRIKDNFCLPSGYEAVPNIKAFVPIHMASQGYWQIQDEDSNNDSTF